MHEEETNKRIQEYEQKIAELNQAIESINEDRAVEVLELADNREREALENLENAFVEMAGEILTRQIGQDGFDVEEAFRESQKRSLAQMVEERAANVSAERQDVKTIEKMIDDHRNHRKKLMGEFKEAIKNRRLNEELIDVLTLLANEPERPSDNPALTQIQAKNAKFEMELKAALAGRHEIEHQVDLLLEKNVRLKAELNQVNREIARGHYLEENMNKLYGKGYNEIRKVADDHVIEITSLKRHRKELKQEIAIMAQKLNETIDHINQHQIEEEYHQGITDFKVKQKARIDEENEKTKKEIHGLADQIKGDEVS
jgi:hypothetical protein